MRGSREISLVPSLHRASTDALMSAGTTSILICSYHLNETLLARKCVQHNNAKESLCRQINILTMIFHVSGRQTHKNYTNNSHSTSTVRVS